MKRVRMLLLGALVVAGAASCEKGLEDQQEKLNRFVAKNRYGSTADMWLLRDGMAGRERVALIYGFAPDAEFCNEVAEMYNAKYPRGARYSCERAN